MRHSFVPWVLVCALAPSLFLVGRLAAQRPAVVEQAQAALAIRNARIVTVSGAVWNKGTVVLRDGFIEAVGESVAIPADASVVEGDGLTVYPGLIDALSGWGMPASLASPAAPGGRGGAQQQPAPAAPLTPTAAAA